MVIFLEIKHNLAVQVHTKQMHLHAEVHEDVGIEQNPPCLVTTTLRSMHGGFLLGDMQSTLTHNTNTLPPSPWRLLHFLKQKKKEHLKCVRDRMGVSYQHEAQ